MAKRPLPKYLVRAVPNLAQDLSHLLKYASQVLREIDLSVTHIAEIHGSLCETESRISQMFSRYEKISPSELADLQNHLRHICNDFRPRLGGPFDLMAMNSDIARVICVAEALSEIVRRLENKHRLVRELCASSV